MDYRAGRSPDGSRDPSTFNDKSSAPLIRDGDMVVFFEGREPIGFDRMKPKTIWQCRHGAFHHDEIIGKPFGSRVFSRTTKGYVYALSPTPELWSHVVPNRTQIVQDFDQSIVIFRLDLKPGDIVVESGTGSGVMSTAIMRTIAPSGFLFTFEFNEIRATRAQEEFEENALGGLAKVAHRDVCAPRADGGGFGEDLDGKADAVFLDLPEPWLAVGHTKLALKPGKKVCSYSPCIEQVMKTCEALRSEGFHSVTTIEFRLRNINYVEMQLDVPDFGSNPAATAGSTPAATATAAAPSTQASPPSVDSKIDCTSGLAAATGAEATEGPVAAGNGDQVAGSAAGGLGEAGEGQESRGDVEGGQHGNETQNTDTGTPGGLGCESEATKDSGGDNTTTNAVSVAATPGGGSSRPTENTNGTARPSVWSESDRGCDSTSASIGTSTSNKRPREEGGATSDGVSVSVRGVSEGGGGGGGGGGDGSGGLGAGRARNERLQPKAAIRAAEAVAGKGGARKPTKLVCAQPFPLMRGHTAFLTFATAPVARQVGTATLADRTTVGGDAVSPEIAADCDVGQKASESKHAGDGASLACDGTDSGGDRGDSAMDVCKQEGIGDEGKGKNRGTDATGSGGEGSESEPTASDTAASSIVAER